MGQYTLNCRSNRIRVDRRVQICLWHSDVAEGPGCGEVSENRVDGRGQGR